MPTIRPTAEQDWAVLKQMRLAALLDAPTAFGVRHASAASYSEAEWRQRATAGRGATFLLAWVGDVAVGLVGHHRATAGAELNLIAMWVAPACRGLGVAAALVDAVKAHALAQGQARIVLDVAPTNGRAVAFYRRHGFVFLPEWEALESHPEITLQKMAWCGVACRPGSD